MRTRARPRPRRDLVKHISLDGLEVSWLGHRYMGMSAYYTGAGVDDAESIRTIHRALDRVDPATPIEETVGTSRAGRGRQDHAHRPFRGWARVDPACARRASGDGAPTRVLPLDARPGGGGHTAGSRTRHRLRGLRAARPRVSDRPGALTRPARHRRLPDEHSPVHRQQLRAEPADRERGRGGRGGGRRRSRSPGFSHKATTLLRSPAPSESRASKYRNLDTIGRSGHHLGVMCLAVALALAVPGCGRQRVPAGPAAVGLGTGPALQGHTIRERTA